MSKAFRCDRCGVCFDPLEIEEGKKCLTINRMIFQGREEFRENKYGILFEDYNMCPKCSEKFYKFMLKEESLNDIPTDLEVIKMVNEIEHIPASVLASMHDAIEREIGRRFDKRARELLYGDSRIFEGPGETPKRKKRAEKDGE